MEDMTVEQCKKLLDSCFCDDVHFNEPTCEKCKSLLEKLKILETQIPLDNIDFNI